jgi:hypothetical protein
VVGAGTDDAFLTIVLTRYSRIHSNTDNKPATYEAIQTANHAAILEQITNQYIEEQTKQWPKEKVQKDKQRSTKHAYKTKDRVTRTPLKPTVNSGASEG